MIRRSIRGSNRWLTIGLMLLTLLVNSSIVAAESYQYVSKMPAAPTGTWYFETDQPHGVAVDTAGNMYIASFTKIKKLNPTGGVTQEWGSYGTGNGQFWGAYGVATSTTGYVYVVESEGCRVQKLTTDGTFVTKWGSVGSGPGQFNNPLGVTVDAAGNVYVVDSGNSRIQKFDENGTYIRSFGSMGTAQGQLWYTGGVAVDATGNVYATNSGYNKVVKYAADGTVLKEWGSSGTGDGQFSAIFHIALDTNGNVYVTDGNNVSPTRRVQKFDSEGNFLAKWGTEGSLSGEFYNFGGITTDAANNVYVSDYLNSRLQKFDSNGGFLAKFDAWGTAEGDFRWPKGLVTDATGNLFVADSANNRIQKIDSSGNVSLSFGSLGSIAGRFNSPEGVAVDTTGNIYVADSRNNRIQKFDSNGALLTQWGSNGTGAGQFNYPSAIAVDKNGDVYVADFHNNRIQTFTTNGTYITEFGNINGGLGTLNQPSGIAIDDIPYWVYVSDLQNQRIVKFTKWGAWVSQLDHKPYGSVFGVALDAARNIYVAGDYGTVRKYDANFNLIAAMSGNLGSGLTGGVTVDAAGKVYLSDTFFNRILQFGKMNDLNIYKGGTGSGIVTSTPAGINCGSVCTAPFTPSALVTLTATADPGSVFTGWTGLGCSGTGTCSVTMNANREFRANFAKILYSLTVTKTGIGTGTVTSLPAGISCGADCTESYDSFTPVTLTATADPGSVFTGWSGGGCSGTGSCTVTMNAATTVTASFTTPPAAPANLVATAASKTLINLSWTDNSSNETGFKIERKSGSVCDSTGWAQIATAGVNKISYANSGLSSKKTYTYRIRSYNSNGNSAYSNCATATTK